MQETRDFHRQLMSVSAAGRMENRALTLLIRRSRKDRASAVVDSSPGGRDLQGHAMKRGGSSQVRSASGSTYGHYPCDGCLLNLIALCGNTYPLLLCPAATIPFGHFLRQRAPVSFCEKETGAPTTAATHVVHGFATTLLVTIGVTNTEVTSNSDADDGAAAQGMDCT